MSGFPTDDLNGTGGAGIMTDIGKNSKPGASRAINLDQHVRDRN